MFFVVSPLPSFNKLSKTITNISILSESEPSVRVFRSRKYPEKTNSTLLVAHMMLEPVAYGLLFVMLVSLGVVLQGFSPIWYTLVGTIFTYVFARMWAVSRAERETAELRIRNDMAMRYSLMSIAKNEDATSWEWVTGIELHPDSLSLSLGHSVVELEKADWPDWKNLVIALSDAAKLGSRPQTI